MSQRLYEACKNGDTEKFRSLVSEGALKETKEYSARDEGLEYSMHGEALEEAARGAAEGDHRELIDLILSYPPYLAKRALHGAMLGACEAGRLDLARHLLEIQGDRRIDWEGCLRTASGANQVKLAKLMIEQGAEMFDWALERTAQTGALDAARFLIERGAIDREGECFGSACWMGFDDLVELFIKKLEVNSLSGLYEALRNRKFSTAELIMTKGRLDPKSIRVPYCIFRSADADEFLKSHGFSNYCTVCQQQH